MFRNYFKTAWRQLNKQKLYTLIKIGGFAAGIAACLMICLFIINELSYEKHIANANRIYRIIGVFNDDGQILKGNDWPAPMATVLNKDYPEVEKAGRYIESQGWRDAGNSQVRSADQTENTYEEGLVYIDQELLEIFNPTFLYGDLNNALTEPNSIVITKQKATKYFPGVNPVGKLLIINNNTDRPYKIGGVIEDLPETSHFQYNFWMSLQGVEFWQGEQTFWRANNYTTYVMLKPGSNADALEKRITKGTLENYFIPAWKEAGDINADKFATNISITLQPLRDIHLRSDDIRDRLHHGDIRIVWIFGGVALFILIIAGINFVNLSTARSASRAKEVGLRKTVGADRTSLVKQFIFESVLYSLLSFIAGVLIAWILLPYFNLLAGKTLELPWNSWWFPFLIVMSAFAVGILAGLYPAFYLSSFRPVQVLKGKIAGDRNTSSLRNILVVFQFTASLILIVSTIVIHSQMKYMLNKKAGFDKDQLLMLQGTGTLGEKAIEFKKTLLKTPGVDAVTISGYFPIEGTRRDQNPFWNQGKRESESSISAQKWSVDADYLPTMKIKMISGRNFNENMSTDSDGIIINKAMADQLQLKDPIGKVITNQARDYRIIGVIEDFHFESMKQSITPLSLVLGGSPDIIAVRLHSTNIPKVIEDINEKWKSFVPNQPIRYTFMDESFERMYADVQKTGQILTSFSIFAIVVACLGLFGLSSFMVERRTKEIGIRKVLGASVGNVVFLLSKDFMKLVFIAILISTPFAWYAMTKWLQNFVYRIDISWWIFAAAGIIAVIIAIITVSLQSVKAAYTNPVNSLRSE